MTTCCFHEGRRNDVVVVVAADVASPKHVTVGELEDVVESSSRP